MKLDTIQSFENRFNDVLTKDIDTKVIEERFQNLLSDEINKVEHSPKTGAFSNLVQGLKDTQELSKSELMSVMLGKSDNAHQALIDMEKAKLEMQFASVTRDKVANSINQLLNMPI